jgi:hypothetical protein
MELIKRLLSHGRCEVFISFMSGFIKRFLDEEKADSLDLLFGAGEWRQIREISGYRDQPLLDLYIKQLKELCGVKYIYSFKMIGEHNQVIYHLIFCTNHIKGLEVMKNAMWIVDRTGDYKFSDREVPGQMYIFDFQNEEYWIPPAAESIYKKFKGLTVNVMQIKEYVIAETPYVFKKEILRYIEKNQSNRIINVTDRKRKGEFLDSSYVTFSNQ